MGPAEAVYQVLAADQALKALVDERIFPWPAPPGAALPNVVYWTVTETPRHTLTQRVALQRALVQLDIRGRNRQALIAIDKAAQAAVQAFRKGHVGSLFVKLMRPAEARDGYEDAEAGQDLPTLVRSREIIVWTN